MEVSSFFFSFKKVHLEVGCVFFFSPSSSPTFKKTHIRNKNNPAAHSSIVGK